MYSRIFLPSHGCFYVIISDVPSGISCSSCENYGIDMYFECGEICHLCCYFSWIFNLILPYSELYSNWVLLLWLHGKYNAWLCDHAYHWYIFLCDKTNSICLFSLFLKIFLQVVQIPLTIIFSVGILFLFFWLHYIFLL